MSDRPRDDDSRDPGGSGRGRPAERGRSRGGRGTDRGGPSQGRRTPPPETTGEEVSYLARHKDARTPVVVHLIDGETVRGVIEYYDRDMIKINRAGGPNVFVRKVSIRYMFEDPDA